MLLLAIAWAGALSTFTAAIATLSLVAVKISPDPSVDTLPLAIVFYASGFANAALPKEIQVLRRGGAYLVGAAAGFLGSVCIAISCKTRSFFTICIGSLLLGCAIAHAQNYRFAAILLAPSSPPKAIGRVLMGGMLGALLGPGAIARARHLLSVDYLGIYVVCSGMYIVVASIVCCIRFPLPAAICSSDGNSEDEEVSKPRGVLEIFSQKRCLAATTAVAASYTLMMLIMAPTPIVMRATYNHSYDEATLVMMGHMFLMFAPSQGTGALVVRFGAPPVIFSGFVLVALSMVALLVGTSVPFFAIGLAVLGVAWNCLFVAGTAALTKTYTPQEGPKVQAVNDGAAFVLSGTMSLASTSVVQHIGWKSTQAVGILSTGLVFMTVALLLALGRKSGAPSAENPSSNNA